VLRLLKQKKNQRKTLDVPSRARKNLLDQQGGKRLKKDKAFSIEMENKMLMNLFKCRFKSTVE